MRVNGVVNPTWNSIAKDEFEVEQKEAPSKSTTICGSTSCSCACCADTKCEEHEGNSIVDGAGKRHHRCEYCRRRLSGQRMKIYLEQGRVRFFECLPCFELPQNEKFR